VSQDTVETIQAVFMESQLSASRVGEDACETIKENLGQMMSTEEVKEEAKVSGAIDEEDVKALDAIDEQVKAYNGYSFEEVDLNGDGVIDPAEFETAFGGTRDAEPAQVIEPSDNSQVETSVHRAALEGEGGLRKQLDDHVSQDTVETIQAVFMESQLSASRVGAETHGAIKEATKDPDDAQEEEEEQESQLNGVATQGQGSECIIHECPAQRTASDSPAKHAHLDENQPVVSTGQETTARPSVSERFAAMRATSDRLAALREQHGGNVSPRRNIVKVGATFAAMVAQAMNIDSSEVNDSHTQTA